jgi:hypothetical protein
VKLGFGVCLDGKNLLHPVLKHYKIEKNMVHSKSDACYALWLWVNNFGWGCIA